MLWVSIIIAFEVKNCLGEKILMSTHYIGFYEEINKLSLNYHQIHTLPVLL